MTFVATGHCGTSDLALTTQGQRSYPLVQTALPISFSLWSLAEALPTPLSSVVLEEALSASPRSHFTPLLSGSAPSPRPARPPRGAHVNDSNKYLIKAAGDAAARQSPLRAGQAGEVGGVLG